MAGSALTDDDNALADEEAEAAGDNAFGVWMNLVGEDPGPPNVEFTVNSGPRIHLPRDSKPIDYLQLFVTNFSLDKIVTETNRYADKWIEDHQEHLAQHPNSRVHVWIKQGNTNRTEIKAFLSICINFGLLKKSATHHYWDSTNPSQATPWFIEHFNRDRFQLLLKFLHFADNDNQPNPESPEYKLYKIKELADHFRDNFRHLYVPGEDIAVDESMVGYRGKTPHLRQYMPQKHHARFGIKLWCVCDSHSHYTVNFEIYKGAHYEADRGEENVTHNLVMRLLQEARLLFCGHHVGMDNYFSSPKLFLELFQANTKATGTVRSNRKGLPKAILKKTLANNTTIERRKGPLLCSVYKDGGKRPVLLSTVAKGGFVDHRNARGVMKHKPTIVVTYNSIMGGVDTTDARLYAYLSERRTLKWTHKLFFNLIGRCVLNSYIIYKEHTTQRPIKNRHQFTVDCIEGLMGNFRPEKTPRKRRRRADEPEGAENEALDIRPPDHDYQAGPSTCILVKIGDGKRRQCMHRVHTTRTKTVWECSACKVTLCPSCFAPYHRAMNLMQ